MNVHSTRGAGGAANVPVARSACIKKAKTSPRDRNVLFLIFFSPVLVLFCHRTNEMFGTQNGVSVLELVLFKIFPRLRYRIMPTIVVSRRFASVSECCRNRSVASWSSNETVRDKGLIRKRQFCICC